MEIKRLDTKLTALKKQLEKLEEAERNGIEKSTPKFNGLGYIFNFILNIKK